MPKRTKYRKVHVPKARGRAKGGRSILYGDFGLVAVTPGRITARQIEAIRVTINRKLKKTGKLFLRMFPNEPVTKKPAETRMGKGKGNPEFWVCVVKRGKVLCEISGIPRDMAKKVFAVASCKLPLRAKLVEKGEPGSGSSANHERMTHE